MKRPVIGILGNVLIMEGGMFPGIERAYVNNDYIEAVRLAGGVPVILPAVTDDSFVSAQIESVDGVIISGGYDIDSLLYGEEPNVKQGFVLPEKDRYDIQAAKAACSLKKPVLGICRGLQVLNVAFGGSLYQDLSAIEGSYIKHTQSSKRDVASHTISVTEGTKLYDILGEKSITNSFHHQAVKALAPGFKVSARSLDGVVEAIEKEGEAFVLGVQWHPEMMAAVSAPMLEIFNRLVAAAMTAKN